MINVSLLRKSLDNKTLICNSNVMYGLISILKRIKNKFLIVNDVPLIDKLKLLVKNKLLSREIVDYVEPSECIFIQDYNDDFTSDLLNTKYYKNIILINTKKYNLKKIERSYKEYDYKLIRITLNYCIMIIS